MAAILGVFGGTAGFVAAVLALILFGAPLLSALAIWAGTGCAFVAFGLLRALAPQADNQTSGNRELA